MRLLRRWMPVRFPEQNVLLESRVPTRHVDPLSDADLKRLNALLPWKCYTVDSHGRPFGGIAGHAKRKTPQSVPDPRMALIDAEYGLAGRRVLELGCFEGVHTVGLCQYGADVVAVDSRIENVVKTIVRANLFGHRPDVRCVDVDSADGLATLPEVDIVHHVGVLYHLVDPVAHLAAISRVAGTGMMLDTQISAVGEDTETYESLGSSWPFKRYREYGRDDVFSGMSPDSKWLTLTTLEKVLDAVGFTKRKVVSVRDERNGPRLLMFCAKG